MQWALFGGLPPESVGRILAAARRVRLLHGGRLARPGAEAGFAAVTAWCGAARWAAAEDG